MSPRIARLRLRLVVCVAMLVNPVTASPARAEGTGTIYGWTFCDCVESRSVDGVTVTAGASSTVSDYRGEYSMVVPAGTYDVGAAREQFGDSTVPNVVVADGQSVRVDIKMRRLIRWPDFNGDGFADATIGVPDDLVEGVRAGSIAIVNGSAAGLDVSTATTWSQSTSGIPGRSEPGDGFGSALAAADFNVDGFDDLVVGSPGEDVGSITDAGSLTVIYGSAAGLTASGAAVWTQDSADVKDHAEVDDRFGSVLVTGLMGASRKPDLAIGVPNEDSGRGIVHVLFGSAGGIAGGDQILSQDMEGVKGTSEPDDRFGAALAMSGVYGSNELLIGVPGEDVGGVRNAGAANVIRPSGGGEITGYADEFWHQGSYGIMGTPEAGDRFGSAVTFLGGWEEPGGYAIGIPGEDIDGAIDAGAVAFIPGRWDGNRIWHQASEGIPGEPETGDRFGARLASGDFDGDTTMDLVVGIPGEDVGNVKNAGAISIQYLPEYQSSPPGVARLFSQATNGVPTDPHFGEAFGASLGVIDFNHDGYLDLICGAPRDLIDGVASGSATVFAGGAQRLQPTAPFILSQATLPGTPHNDEAFGYAIADRIATY